MEDNRKINYSVENIMTEGNPFSDKPSYTPTAGDKIWFYPGCDIPRFKVKQFCMNNNVSIVKTKDRSTVRFMGQETVNQTRFHDDLYYMGKDAFLTWLDSVMCNAYMQMRDDIAKCPSDIVYIDHSAYRDFCDEELFAEKIMLPEGIDLPSTEVYRFATPESYQQLVDMISDPGLYYQDDMLSLLNTGIVIDEDMYKRMHELFKSSDADNTRLAMEAMANCDFQKSAVYLLLLMQKYGTKIYNSGTKHHVNFKSLIKYFQIKNINSISVDDMIDSLRHQKLLSLSNLNYLMPMALNRLRENGEMKNIKIKDLELSSEAEKAVAENILDKQVVTTSAPNPIPEPKPNQESLVQ